MTEYMYEVQYGETTIQYTLTYAPRKTLAITVEPDLRVRVTAPTDTTLAAVEAALDGGPPW